MVPQKCAVLGGHPVVQWHRQGGGAEGPAPSVQSPMSGHNLLLNIDIRDFQVSHSLASNPQTLAQFYVLVGLGLSITCCSYCRLQHGYSLLAVASHSSRLV